LGAVKECSYDHKKLFLPPNVGQLFRKYFDNLKYDTKVDLN